MTKKTYVRAQAELMNVAAEKTLFTASSSDDNNDDGRPGKWCPEFLGCFDNTSYDDYNTLTCGNNYCDAGDEWVDC